MTRDGALCLVFKLFPGFCCFHFRRKFISKISWPAENRAMKAFFQRRNCNVITLLGLLSIAIVRSLFSLFGLTVEGLTGITFVLTLAQSTDQGSSSDGKGSVYKYRTVSQFSRKYILWKCAGEYLKNLNLMNKLGNRCMCLSPSFRTTYSTLEDSGTIKNCFMLLSVSTKEVNKLPADGAWVIKQFIIFSQYLDWFTR